jgi:hypothetical protein
MKLPVLVEPVAGAGYRARAMAPFDWSAEGPTAEAAVAKLQEEANRHAGNGARVAAIEVPDYGSHAWLTGTRPLDLHDPVIQEWLDIIEENRRAADNDPNVL